MSPLSREVEPRHLLPTVATHPLTMLICVVLPHFFLLGINLNAYHLISDEINALQQKGAFFLFAGQWLVLACGLIPSIFYLRKRKAFPWAWNWVVLLPNVIYLVLFCFQVHRIIPGSLQVWIVPPENLISAQFVGLMPATFLAALGLACFPTKRKTGLDASLSLLAAAGVPFAWYLAVHLPLGFRSGSEMSTNLLSIFFVVSTIVCLAGILRILMMVFNALQSAGTVAKAILLFILCVAGPVGGLLLNQKIPFPADFQNAYIYILAILNGILLMIPRFSSASLQRWTWLAQCFSFPFTLYFFVVFLPYLPLAVLAMIAAGAGVLILVPTLLFVVHLMKLAEGLPGKGMIPAGVGMALVVPFYLFVEAKMDRVMLNRAIDYVYSPDYENGDTFRGSRLVTKRSLNRLHQVKQGIYLPFLTQIYDQIVLDGLVLSDRKLNQIYTSLFGTSLAKENSGRQAFGFFERRHSRGRGREWLAAAPPKNVKLVSVTVQHQEESELIRTLIKLEIHNPTLSQSEFTTPITIPRGMYVSGYWLDINGERVPGQIFEEKTAMWVYRMIRDATRRDPGLLTYLSPDRLRLRVFPVEAGQTRFTEIEFISPKGFSHQVQVGEQTLGDTANSVPLMHRNPGSGLFTFNSQAIDTLPSLKRNPYFHFIVDRSLWGMDASELKDRIAQFRAKHPEISHCRVTLTNYEFHDLNGGESYPMDQFSISDDLLKLPKRGGFLMERALKRCLVKYEKKQSTECPFYVVLSGEKSESEQREPLEWFRDFLPDVGSYYYQAGPKGTIKARSLQNHEATLGIQHREVCLLKCGEEIKAIAAKGNVRVFFSDREAPLLVYQQDRKGFAAVTLDHSVQPAIYASATEGWARSEELVRKPSLINTQIRALVEHSREHGILLPGTAYMVVENSAQWKILQQKEKEKLKGNHALDHMETPEPSWLWLAALYFLGVVGWKIRQLWRSARRGNKTA